MPTDQIKHEELLDFIKRGLEEDVRDGDHTSLACIPATGRSKARLLVKDTGVIAGVDLARTIFEYVDESAEFELLKEDGSSVGYGDEAFRVTCNAQALLKAERLVLNTMQLVRQHLCYDFWKSGQYE